MEKSSKSKRVLIKHDLLKNLPFSQIQSRNATAIVLSFYAESADVFKLLQRLSHTSRAYIHNAGGLKGFLIKSAIVRILEQNLESQELWDLMEYQHIDIEEVIEDIKGFNYNSARLAYLEKRYPALYIFVMQKRRQQSQVDDFMAKCKKNETDYEQYSYYVHGWLLPWLYSQLHEGLLKLGTKMLNVMGIECEYTGELDEQGKACGDGVAVCKSNPALWFKGTFKDDRTHGLLTMSHRSQEYRLQAETWTGLYFGKVTERYSSTKVFNLLYGEKQVEKHREPISVDMRGKLFYKDGKANNVFDPTQIFRQGSLTKASVTD